MNISWGRTRRDRPQMVVQEYCGRQPGDDGLWLDDDQRRAPLAPHTRQPDPEPAVRSGEPQPSRPRSLQHLQLVAQGQHLQLQDDARAHTTSEGQQKRDEDSHDRRKAYSLIARKINGINKNGLFGSHNSSERPRRHRRCDSDRRDRRPTRYRVPACHLRCSGSPDLV